jgi:spore germination protein GerM
MTRRHAIQAGVGVVLLALLAWGMTSALEYLVTPRTSTTSRLDPDEAAAERPHITATLYYARRDGDALVPVRRDVPHADGAVAQARAVLIAQLAPVPSPFISVIPMGTTLRAFYVTTRGDAFVDLSREVSSNHPGGSFAEQLTVAAIVNAVATGLPTVRRVQILIEGREVDTLAGHVDLRRPLARDVSLVGDEVQ